MQRGHFATLDNKRFTSSQRASGMTRVSFHTKIILLLSFYTWVSLVPTLRFKFVIGYFPHRQVLAQRPLEESQPLLYVHMHPSFGYYVTLLHSPPPARSTPLTNPDLCLCMPWMSLISTSDRPAIIYEFLDFRRVLLERSLYSHLCLHMNLQRSPFLKPAFIQH